MKKPVPPAVACPGCGQRLRQRGEFWVCVGHTRGNGCHMAVPACPDCQRPMKHVLACPDCQRPMKHVSDGIVECAHCNSHWHMKADGVCA
jgi:hypothetical protein